MNFIDKSGLTYVFTKIKALISDAVSGKADSTHSHAAGDITSGTLPISRGGTGASTAANALKNLGVTATAAELNILDGVTATTTELNYVDGVTSNIQTQLNAKAASSHSHSNYENQNAFSNVTVGETTIAADAISDTLTLVAGSNVTITPDATNDKITIAATNTTYSAAGSSLGLVKSGGDVTISSGVITVNDDSHNHVISNVYGLQTALDGKETRGAAASALTEAKSYTDTKISALINSAPSTLDTLGEIATAMEENAEVVEALEAAIGNKAAASDLTSHTGNKSNPHGVTLSQLGVTASADELNYMDGVTSAVQTQLNGKAASSHNHSASNITSGTLGVARGGTGVTSNPSMLIDLASTSAASVFASSPRPGVTGALPIANGGTGATTAAAALTNLGIGAMSTTEIDAAIAAAE